MINNIEILKITKKFIWIYDRKDEVIKRVPWYCTCPQAHPDKEELAINELTKDD